MTEYKVEVLRDKTLIDEESVLLEHEKDELAAMTDQAIDWNKAQYNEVDISENQLSGAKWRVITEILQNKYAKKVTRIYAVKENYETQIYYWIK